MPSIVRRESDGRRSTKGDAVERRVDLVVRRVGKQAAWLPTPVDRLRGYVLEYQSPPFMLLNENSATSSPPKKRKPA